MTEPMRIVELVPSLGVGGAERIVALMALELARAGQRVSVVSLAAAQDSWIEGQLRQNSVELHFLDKTSGLDARAIPRLARRLGHLRPHVVHSHLHVLKYLLPALAATRARSPLRPRCHVVHTLHNMADKEAVRADRVVQQAAFRAGVRPVAIGEAVADSLRRLYRLEPAWTIPNGIPIDDFQVEAGTRIRLRAELAIPDRVPLFVVVGRLNPQKNHALLLEAMADRRLAELGAQLLVVGDGELREELEDRARKPDLAGRSHFLGIRRDVPDLLAAADLFVLSSDWEGNPLVVMEAMAAGRAVVATSVGCVPELVVPDTGRLVRPGDRTALADALVELADNLELTARLGAQARLRARRRYGVAAMSRAYLRAFASLSTAGHSPDPHPQEA